MVIAKSKDGIKRRLIYAEGVLMVDKNDEISFDIIDEATALRFKINFKFSDEGKELTFDSELLEDGKLLELVLHKWVGVAVENTTPFTLKHKLDPPRLIWVKWRTAAATREFRSMDISVWLEEK